MKLSIRRALGLFMAMTACPFLFAQDCVPTPRSLTGWWPGEGSTASVFDAAPPGGVGVSYVPGRVGQAFSIGSAGAGIGLGAPAYLDTQQFTVHAWVQRTSVDVASSDGSGVGWILARSVGSFGFGLRSDGRLVLRVLGTGNELVSDGAIGDTGFHHVAVVRSGATVTFHLDGAASGGGSLPVFLSYGGASAIGRRGDDGSGSFAGVLDEVAFVDRAVTAAHLTAVHAAGASGMCALPADVANDIPAATERLVQGSGAVGNLTATTDGFAIDGQLRLESANGGYLSAIAITTGAVTNREAGVISIRRGSEGPRGFNGPLWNQGLFEALWPVTANVPDGSLVNTGTWTVTAPGSLSLRGAGLRLDLVGGSFTGGERVDGDGVGVRFRGGTFSGAPYLVNSSLEFDPRNTSAGAFTLTGSGSTLTGELQAGQQATISGSATAGNTSVRAPLGLRSAGVLRLQSLHGGYLSQLDVSGGPLVNEVGGLFESARGTEGPRGLLGQLENDGTVRINWPLTLTASGGMHVNRGEIVVAAGMTFALRGTGQTFRQAAGRIQSDGQLDVEGMAFRYESGEMVGTAYLAGVDLTLAPTGEDPVSMILSASSSRARGRLNANQSLWVRGDGRVGHTTVAFPEGFTVGGTLRMESANGGYVSSIAVDGGPLTIVPGGSFLVRRGAEGPRTVAAELVNQGLASFQWHTGLGRANAVHRNSGTFSIASGIGVDISGGDQVLRQEDGLLDLQGSLVLSGARFEYLGGQIQGVPYLDGTVLKIGPGTGPAEFNLTRSSSRIEGSVQPGQVLNLRGDGRGGHTTILAPAGLENAGTLRIGSYNGGYVSALTVTGGPLLNRPSGLVHVLRLAEGPRSIGAVLENEGTTRIGWHTTLSAEGAVHVNRGRLQVDPGIQLTLGGLGQTLSHQAGILDVQGALDLSQMSFQFLGGEITGRPYLDGVNLLIGPDATAPAALTLTRSSTVVRGRVHPGQDLWIRGDGRGGHTTASFPDGLEVGGLLRLESVSGGYVSAVSSGPPGLRILPSGTLLVGRGPEGPRAITGDWLNEGTVDIRWHTSHAGSGATFRNVGEVNISPGIELALGGTGQRLVQAGGNLRIDGGLFLDDDTFRYEGGLVTGTARLRHSRLELPASAGPGGQFLMRGNTVVTGAVPARAVVIAEGSGDGGHANLNLPGGLTVNGTLRVTAVNGGYTINVASPAQPLVVGPSGIVEILRGSDGTRRVDSAIVNRGLVDVRWHSRVGKAGEGMVSEGRVSLAPGVALTVDGPLQLVRGRLDGAGTIVGTVNSEALVAPGPGRATLRMEGPFRQGARGILDLELDEATQDQLVVTGGASLSGLVRVSLAPGYVPAIGRSAQLVSASLDGARPRVELSPLPEGRAWQVDFGAGLLVRVVAEPEPTPGASIVGIVTDADGQAVPDVTVFASGGKAGGLLAEYWAGTSPTGEPRIRRLESTLNQRWGNGGPGGSVGTDNFFGRWTGELVAPASETFRIYTISDDGIRVWIGGVLLFENWTQHADTENSATIALEAGRRYPIRVEFFEAGGGATAVLEWSSPSVARQVIPPSALIPPPGTPPSVLDQITALTGPDGRYEIPVPSGAWTVDLAGLDALGFEAVTPVQVEVAAEPVIVDFRLEASTGDRLPNLVSSGLVAPATGVAGQPVSVTWQTSNTGENVARAPWRETLLLGRQPSGFDAVEIGRVEVTADLVAGASVGREVQAAIPPGLSGAWYLFVRLDPGLAVDEGEGEIDNLGEPRPIQLLIGDLVVERVEAPAALNWGDSVDITWVVRNTGGSAVSAPWTDSVYFSAVPSGGTLLADLTPARTTPLAPGETHTNTVRVTVPLNSQNAPGTWYFLVRTDRTTSQVEANDSNNLGVSAGVTFNRPTPPDLVVREVEVPAVVAAGRPVEVRWKVRNEGATTAIGPWREVIALAVSPDAPERQVLVALEFNEPLAPGAEVTRSRTVLFPADRAGSHFLAVEADSPDRVFEGGPAANNTGFSAAAFRINAPDLVAVSIQAPSGRFGEPLAVSWVVRNSGNTAAKGEWLDRLVLVGPGVERVVAQRARPGQDPFASGTTYTQALDLVIPLGLAAGDYSLRLDSDFRSDLLESAENNNQATSAAFRLELPPLPDLVVSAASAPGAALPGQPIEVVWQIANNGAASAPGGFVVRFDLVPPAPEPVQTIGSLRVDAALAAAGVVGATNNLNLPASVAGAIRIRVSVDAAGEVYESNEANNVRETADPTQVARQLGFRLPVESVPENATPPIVRARISRSGPVAAPLTVALASSNTAEATVPGTLEIPAGSAFADVDVGVVADGRVDGAKVVQLTASADGFNAGLATLTVTDVDRAVLVLLVETNRVREGLSLPARIRRSEPAAEDIQVELAATSPDITPPATVTLPAGAVEVAIALIAPDNDRLEPVRGVRITAAAAGHVPATTDVEVVDDDDPGLTLAILPASIGEGDGPLAGTARLRRARGVTRSMRVRVAVDDPARLVAPPEVFMPAGREEVAFNVGPVDNRLNDGPKAVQVTASIVEGLTGAVLAVSPAATVTVQDDDSASLRISLGTGVAREGRSPAFTGVVLRNSDTAGELVVQLASSDTTEATVPDSVTIPAGQASAPFPVTTLEDGVIDGNQRLTLTATAAGHAPGSAALTVSDSDLPDLAITLLTASESGTTGGDGQFRYRVANQGVAPATGPFSQRLYLSLDGYVSADDTLLDDTPVSGPMQPGGFVERELTRRLPSTAGSYYVIAVADAGGAVMEILEDNNRAVAAGLLRIDPAYAATVATDITAAPAGTPIPLRGRAQRPGGAAAAAETVTVYVRVKGTERRLLAITDLEGRFETVFQPVAGEYGRYEVAAGHPGASAPASQDSFELLGLIPEPLVQFTRIIPGRTNEIRVSLRNPNDLPLTGLRFEGSAVDALGLAIDGPVRLEAGESGEVRVRVWSLEDRDAAGRFVVRITSGEGARADFAVDYSVEPPLPRLVAIPSRLDVGMVRGRQAVVEFEVVNQGGADSGPLDLTLPDIPWMKTASVPPLPSLAPGERARIALVLTPDETVALGLHDGRLAVGNEGARVTVPFTVRHVSDALGDLEVAAHDENTYYGNRENVAGAAVVLRDVFDSHTVRSAVTGSNGVVVITGVPEGTYNLEVSAPRHDAFIRTITVAPGVLNKEVAFLRTQLVRYNWKVEEVEFEERATIRLETIFETTVPVPVVTIEPGAIDLTGIEADEHTVELRVTNQGIIAVQDVELRFADGSKWRVLPLAEDLGAIPPKSSVTVPVTFVRVQPGGQAGGGRAAGPAAGFVTPPTVDECRPPSIGVGWELLCGQFGVAYWSPVVVYDLGLCPPPPLTIARDPLGWLDYIPQVPYIGPGNGTGRGRGFPIDVGWGPRNFVGYSGTNDCNCLKTGYAEKCVSAEAGFKADATEAAQAVLNRVLGPVKWLSVQGFEVKFGGSAKLCTCCEEIDGQGVTGLKLEGDVGGSIEAKLFAGPQVQVDVPGLSFPGLTGVKTEVFAGAGVELTATGSIKVNGKTECFLSKPEVFVDARIRLGTPIGLKGKGKIKGTDSTGTEIEYEGEFFGGLDLGAYAYVSGYIVGGDGKTTADGCLEPIVLKGEIKATRTVNGVFEAIGVGVSKELLPKYCINEQPDPGFSLTRLGEAEAISRMLGHSSPADLLPAVSGVAGAGDGLSVTSSPREISDRLVRHLGIRPVRTGDPVGLPVFTQSLASSASVDAARREASAHRQEARSARPAAGNDGVCAQVKLEIEQQAVVTRKGIGATLEIINESTDLPLEDIGVSIQIYDRLGNEVGDRFLILPPELTRLQPMGQLPTNRLVLGGLALSLPADTTGSARWLIVPKDTAAPEEPTQYFVGGHLTYRSGEIVRTAELTPGAVTVYPNARLFLKYFHQRDVFSDDPFTDAVEPSQPFVLGVMVHNRGRGLAKNFSITSAQPRIVDNAKGLLINFEIIATEVAGQPLSPSLTAAFGDVDPGDIAIGRWLLKSTLQGHFIDYKATLEHEDRFGERGASVFEGVEIHELIRQVEAGGTFADGKPDFLVNDVADPSDLPDTLHLSDASTAPVAVVLDGVVEGAPTAGDLEVDAVVRAPSGWVYLRLSDPADGTFRLAQVRRPDGSLVPRANFWTTDRTFIGLGRRPLVENRIHLLDHNPAGRYTLVYRRDESVPDTLAPASQVTALPVNSPVLVPVRWTGADDATGSGVDSYDVFVSVDGGPFTRWLTATRNQSAFYRAAAGRRYAFYSVARDVAGNVEPAPGTPDTATVVVGNSAPEFEPVADVTVDEGQRAETTLRAVDLDLPGDTLRFELVSGPTGAALDPATGLFAWQTSEADGPSTRTVRVRVSDDGEPPASSEREFRVIVREVNQPVSLRPVPAELAAVEGVPFRLQLVAEDADVPANSLLFSLLPGAPAGAVINPASGEVVWTPAEVQGGLTHPFEVQVSDRGSPATTARTTFRVAVSKTNSAPVLDPIASSTVWEGDLVERTVRAVDGDLPVQEVRYALAPGAASGAILDNVTGRFTWEPLEVHADATHAFTVIARDTGEPVKSGERTFTVSVRPLHPGLNLPARASNGEVTFRFKGRVGVRHLLQGSIDLVNWTPLEEFTTQKPVHPLVDRSSIAFPWRYFRVIEVQ